MVVVSLAEASTAVVTQAEAATVVAPLVVEEGRPVAAREAAAAATAAEATAQEAAEMGAEVEEMGQGATRVADLMEVAAGERVTAVAPRVVEQTAVGARVASVTVEAAEERARVEAEARVDQPGEARAVSSRSSNPCNRNPRE